MQAGRRRQMILSLPMYPDLGDTEFAFVADAIDRTLAELGPVSTWRPETEAAGFLRARLRARGMNFGEGWCGAGSGGRRLAWLGVFLLLWTAPASVTPAVAGGVINSSLLGGVAIEGTDPVAYFIEGKPVEGSRAFEHEWMDATWRFVSAANRDLFAADPEKYAPQYGGYCAWAVSQGYTAKIDPEAWKIVDGKLYLNYSKDVQTQWSGDIPGNIEKGDANWPKIRADLAG